MGCSITGPQYRWMAGVVPYSIDESDFPDGSNERKSIEDAITHWNNNTNIRLIPRNGHNDHVIFKEGAACGSRVGRQGGQQTINCDLDSGNFGTGNIIHEIGHAVGLWHEHAREDRDSFITVNWDNIIEDGKHNFEKHVDDGTDIGQYDYGSIMHYGRMGFAIDTTKNTITPPAGVSIGQRSGLSNGDITSINWLYNRKSEFYTTDGRGNIIRLDRFNGRWRSNWHIILSGNFGGSLFSDLLFYDKSRGEGEFYTTNGLGRIQRLGNTYRGWRKTWKFIIQGNFGRNGYTDLLFYDSTKGEGEFYTTDGHGRISILGNTHKRWRKSWDMIIPGNFGGSGFTDLLFYDKDKGEGEFYTSDGNGRIRPLGNTHRGWRISWDMIIPGNFGGNGFTDLLFYDKSKGEGEFYTTDGNGRIRPLGNTHRGWRKTWKFIIPGNFGRNGFTDLLFYDSIRGQGEFYTTVGHGRISILGNTHKGWRQGWDMIVSGNYGRTWNHTDLLFYDKQA